MFPPSCGKIGSKLVASQAVSSFAADQKRVDGPPDVEAMNTRPLCASMNLPFGASESVIRVSDVLLNDIGVSEPFVTTRLLLNVIAVGIKSLCRTIRAVYAPKVCVASAKFDVSVSVPAPVTESISYQTEVASGLILSPAFKCVLKAPVPAVDRKSTRLNSSHSQ